MATKSVLKSSASALLALLLGTAALLPTTASAQERPDRGERGAGRAERAPPPPAPVRAQPQAQAPRAPVMAAPSGWQGRAPVANTPSGWQGRPAWQNGNGDAARQTPPANPGGWQGRQSWQNGAGDRERGDRGNGVNPAGQPAFGRPAWGTNGGQTSQPSQPAWGTRNPTYVDPARGRPAGERDDRAGQNRGDPNRDGQRNWQRDGQNTWQGGNNRGGDRPAPYLGHDGRWSPDDNRDHDQRWRGNNYGRGYGWGTNNGWRGNGGGYNNGRHDWDRDSWRRDNRYDWSGWRNRHRSTFSLGFYSAPWRDYSYSRLSIGVVIGAPFYSQRYWIADPWAYRLPPADGPYRWVRYYDDALLVDIYSGEVVDVIYDIFY